MVCNAVEQPGHEDSDDGAGEDGYIDGDEGVVAPVLAGIFSAALDIGRDPPQQAAQSEPHGARTPFEAGRGIVIDGVGSDSEFRAFRAAVRHEIDAVRCTRLAVGSSYVAAVVIAVAEKHTIEPH